MGAVWLPDQNEPRRPPRAMTASLANHTRLTVGSLVLGAVLAVGPAHLAAIPPPSALRTE